MKFIKYIVLSIDGDPIETNNLKETLKKIEESFINEILKDRTYDLPPSTIYFEVYENDNGLLPEEIQQYYGIEEEIFEKNKKYVIIPKYQNFNIFDKLSEKDKIFKLEKEIKEKGEKVEILEGYYGLIYKINVDKKTIYLSSASGKILVN